MAVTLTPAAVHRIRSYLAETPGGERFIAASAAGNSVPKSAKAIPPPLRNTASNFGTIAAIDGRPLNRPAR